ncbi:hypothetical protein G9A89_021716 [Geosiphon pyriformis]|nr:hypothetical protein G9A89_021716 [Geosiphon pyriformis]
MGTPEGSNHSFPSRPSSVLNLQHLRIPLASDIRVVILGQPSRIGFAYAFKSSPDQVVTNDVWPEQTGQFKTNTALLYDEEFNVKEWGYPALAQEPRKKLKANQKPQPKPAELFKLFLGNLDPNERPKLPPGLEYHRAIVDFLRCMNKLIYTTINSRWPGLRFPQQVLFVMSVPAEWSDEARGMLRSMAFEAGLIEERYSRNLEFTTEPEAAAIHCISILKEHSLPPDAPFMIVDCGGGTVDLTTRSLSHDRRLSEITIRTGDYCGSSFVDKNFLNYISKKVGVEAMLALSENNYGQLQYLVQQFCLKIKHSFNGNLDDYKVKEFDLERICPAILKYVTGETKERLEEDEWLIEFDFDTVRAMFDPIIEKILMLIGQQLTASGGYCRAIFMVGGFSENHYLQWQVRHAFAPYVPIIAVPKHPIAAVERGALQYGLYMATVQSRVLKWTYGIDSFRPWTPQDPPERRTQTGYITVFRRIAQRGIQVAVNQRFTYEASPVLRDQKLMTFNIYATPYDNAIYCDDLGVRLIGRLSVHLPQIEYQYSRILDIQKPTESDNQIIGGSCPRERGVIIDVSSIAYIEASAGFVAYAASKGEVHFHEFWIRYQPRQPKQSVKLILRIFLNTPMALSIQQDEALENVAIRLVENTYMNDEVIRIDGKPNFNDVMLMLLLHSLFIMFDV